MSHYASSWKIAENWWDVGRGRWDSGLLRGLELDRNMQAVMCFEARVWIVRHVCRARLPASGHGSE